MKTFLQWSEQIYRQEKSYVFRYVDVIDGALIQINGMKSFG